MKFFVTRLLQKKKMVRCFSRLVYIELQCTLETSLPKFPLCFFVLSSKNKHCPADMVFHPRKMLITPPVVLFCTEVASC